MTLEEAILKALSEKTGISSEEIKSKTRTRDIATCRQIGYYLYRNVYKSITSFQKCGMALFSIKQDHSTVIHAIATAEIHIKNERHIRMLCADVKERVDELMKQQPSTKPINQIMKEVSDSLNNVILAIPYNNVSNFRTNQKSA